MLTSSHALPCTRAVSLLISRGTWHDMSVFYWLTKMTLGMTLKIVFRPRAWGVKNVPRRGPVILASNHLSFSDHFFGPLPVPRKVIFLAKSEYFTGRGLKGLISRAFFTGVGQIPIDRGGGAASEQAIRTGLSVLAAGNVLGIYPEGTRSPDGRLYRGKTGVARLALESGAPVVPCAMIDTFQFQPPGTLRPNMGFRPGVRFGEALDFSRYHGRETDGPLLRTITDEIMQAIAKLSGQEYVDIDARRAKAELASGHDGASGHDTSSRDHEGHEGGQSIGPA
jgi:1-acyl-sn-glycerol-3-phosphate acyltransferase